MDKLLGAMGSIILTWLFLAPLFTGIGLVTWRILGRRIGSLTDLFTAFWMGWASVILFLQFWHLVFPIDVRAFMFFSLFGMVGLIWNRRELWQRVVKLNDLKYWFFVVVFLACGMFLANRALDYPQLGDNSFYHLHTVRWAASYPIVPGLGNLHDRLAFNSSHFLYVALLDWGPWAYRAYHLANGLLLFVFISQILWSGYKLFTAIGKYERYHFFNFLFLMPALHLALARHNEVSSIGNDLPLFILGAVISARFLLLFDDKAKVPPDVAAHTILLITVLAAASVTVKISAAPLTAITCLVAFVIWIIKYHREYQARLNRLLFKMIAIAALLVIPWMVRGTILGGYPAYPVSLGGVPVEWRIPEETAIQQSEWVRSYARNPDGRPDEVLDGLDWLKPWFIAVTKRYYKTLLPLGLAGLAGLILFYKRASIETSRIQWLFFVPALVAAGFWFVVAPGVRFAGAIFWIIGIGAVTFVLSGLDRLSPRLATLISVGLLIAMVPVLIYYYQNLLILEPGPDRGFYPVPNPNLDTFVTDSGLKIYAAKDGAIDCWDGPLPCTPYPDPRLRLRVEGELRHGFILDNAGEQVFNAGD